MFGQAAGFALLAACSPTAMLLAAVFLISERPGRTAAFYLAGGILVVTVMGTLALIAMRAGGLSHPGERPVRYGLRLGLGVVALIAAFVIARRKPGPPERAKQRKPNLVARLAARPAALTAFAAGLIVFGPGLTFVAAIQVVASAQASLAATVGAMVMIVVLTVCLAWLPLVAYLITPDGTLRRLNSANDWIRRNAKVVLATAVGIIGILLVIQGVAGVAG